MTVGYGSALDQFPSENDWTQAKALDQAVSDANIAVLRHRVNRGWWASRMFSSATVAAERFGQVLKVRSEQMSEEAKCEYCGTFGEVGRCMSCGAPNRPCRVLFDVTSHGDKKPRFLDLETGKIVEG